MSEKVYLSTKTIDETNRPHDRVQVMPQQSIIGQCLHLRWNSPSGGRRATGHVGGGRKGSLNNRFLNFTALSVILSLLS